MKRQFKGVWMPREIYLHPDLTPTEKFLVTEISSLQGEEGCFASNEYLADFLGTSEKTVANSLTKLKELGIVRVEGYGTTRRIFVELSQNQETEPKNPEIGKLVSRKKETTFPKSGNSIYRNINTEINTAVVDAAAADSAYDLYRKYYAKVPLHNFNQEMLMSIDRHLDVFQEVLEIWVGRQYREQNIKGMMSLYERLLTDKNNKEQKLFCDKCEANSGWLPVGEGWERCKH